MINLLITSDETSLCSIYAYSIIHCMYVRFCAVDLSQMIKICNVLYLLYANNYSCI